MGLLDPGARPGAGPDPDPEPWPELGQNSGLQGMGRLISLLEMWRSGVVSPSVWTSFSLALLLEEVADLHDVADDLHGAGQGLLPGGEVLLHLLQVRGGGPALFTQVSGGGGEEGRKSGVRWLSG